MAGHPGLVKPEATQWVLALGCASLWTMKFWLISRLNINWDEFYFLSLVHAGSRGELAQGLQTFHTHLFAWLPGLSGDEITQIIAARVLMVALLGVNALLIQRLASRWYPPTAAWTAVLAFLALWPTLKHGGSFRADSLLLPLQLGALLILTDPRRSDRGRGLIAGMLLGIASAITIKAVLLLPVVLVLGIGELREWRRGVQRLAWLAGAALSTAAILLGAHFLSITEQGATASRAVQGAWQKTIGESPWFPQMDVLQSMFREDRIFWLTAGFGLGWALWRRQWGPAACAMALLPVVFYRNSYAYYYVVMWGPACITIAAASAGLLELISRRLPPLAGHMAVLSLAVLLGMLGASRLPSLLVPRQGAQRELVAAVHSIFPNPVAYVDHSGMIASFRKANFFMSSWGVEGYIAAGQPFMPRAIARHQPPLLIANRPVLTPGTYNFGRLLPQDQRLIESGYLPYWGPIRIAGAATHLQDATTTTLRLPLPGLYRLESPRPVRLNGSVMPSGAVFTAGEDQLEVAVAIAETLDEAVPVRLIWAAARPAPASPPSSLAYYDPL